MSSTLDGAACAELPAFVVDKYFHSPGTGWNMSVAKAICSRCVVLRECRERAFNGQRKQQAGVIGGVAVGELGRARAWRRYELGLRDRPPSGNRPDWLALPEAVDMAESTRVAADMDEQRVANEDITNHRKEGRL